MSATCSPNDDVPACSVFLALTTNMADVALGQLRFAGYSVNLGSVPTKFDVSPESLLLANSVIPNHSFKVENEVIAKADKANALAEQARKMKEEQSASKESKESSGKEVKEETAVKTEESKADDSPLLDLNFDIGLDEAKPAPAIEAKPQEPSPIAMVAPTPVLSHDATVAIMVEQTKQDKDVCYFYLECADWNMENAIELLKSMQAISN